MEKLKNCGHVTKSEDASIILKGQAYCKHCYIEMCYKGTKAKDAKKVKKDDNKRRAKA